MLFEHPAQTTASATFHAYGWILKLLLPILKSRGERVTKKLGPV